MTEITISPPAEVTTALPAAPAGGGLVGAIAAIMAEVHTVAKLGINEHFQLALCEDRRHPEGNHAAARQAWPRDLPV